MENSSAPVTEHNLDQQPEQAKKNSLVLPAILVILGMLVMLYPVVSTAWNNYAQQKASSEYNKLETSVPQEVKDTQWERAHAYNESRKTGPILDPWLNSINDQNPQYAEYLDQLNATDAMARLIFPKIKADLPVYHGTSDDTLQKGLGHLYGSDLPVGGAGTHSIITGHTGLSNATLFDNLVKAKKGDPLYVQVSGHKLKYVVDQIKVVLPHETDELKPVEGQDFITLITCTPYGINTHRLLVRGHQVAMDPSESVIFDKNHGAGWQWWMYALLAAVFTVGAALAWWVWRQKQKQDAEEESAAGVRTSDEVSPAEEESDFDDAQHSRGHTNTEWHDDNETSWWERDND
nr:class C sortase [Corynebacterium lactis]